MNVEIKVHCFGLLLNEIPTCPNKSMWHDKHTAQLYSYLLIEWDKKH